MCTVDPQEPHDLVLAVSNRPAEKPVISAPWSTTKTTTKSSKWRLCPYFSPTILIAATWFTASSAWKSVLLAPRVIKIHKPKIGNKLYCDSSLQTRSPAASFISPLSKATCHTHKPSLWCSILILLVCSFRSSTSGVFRMVEKPQEAFAKYQETLKRKHKGTDLSFASSKISILKSGSKLQ